MKFPRLFTLMVFIFMNSSFSQELQAEKLRYFDQVFREVDSVLQIDGGKMWGKSLVGPILLVHPNSRKFVANENSIQNEFLFAGNVWHGVLPIDINIANGAVDWLGKRWAMVMLDLPKGKKERNNLIIHESFHRIQPSMGFTDFNELSTEHLDSFEGRLLLRLELEALQQALKSKRNGAWYEHITNALTFRFQRHQIRGAKASENPLELNEGMAQYTANQLSIAREETVPYLIRRIKNFLEQPSWLRAFAYETIPVYGYLLYHEKPNWHKEINKRTNLSDFLYESFDFEKNKKVDWERIAKNGYGFTLKRKLEKERDRKQRIKVANQMYWYHTKPTLELKFYNMNISFNYQELITLKGIGTIYPEFDIKDQWGTLKATKGGLILRDWSRVVLSSPRVFRKQKISGKGWVLKLNPGWTVKKKGSRYSIEKNRL